MSEPRTIESQTPTPEATKITPAELLASPELVNNPYIKQLQEMNEENLRSQYMDGINGVVDSITKWGGIEPAQKNEPEVIQRLGIISAVAQVRGIVLAPKHTEG